MLKIGKCITFVLLALLSAPGCMQKPDTYYEAVYFYPDASPEEIDDVVTWTLTNPLAPHLVRSIAGEGELHLFFQSKLSDEQLAKLLMALDSKLPEAMSFRTITKLPKGLPDKPKIEQVPQLRIQTNKEANRLGVGTMEILEAIGALDTKDPDVIKENTFKTPGGKTVHFAEVATYKTEMGPSHIIRDYPENKNPK